MPKFLSLLLIAVLLPLVTLAQNPVAAPEAPRPGLRPSYSFQAGTMFAGRYGAASYLSPTVSLPLSRRFAVLAGLTYLRTMPGAAFAPLGETGQPPLAGTSRVLVQGGGQYALSERLLLTGSAWKDLTPAGRLGVNPYAGFGGSLGQGINLRADYHITENFSISGGIRASSGTTAYPGGLYSGFGGW